MIEQVKFWGIGPAMTLQMRDLPAGEVYILGELYAAVTLLDFQLEGSLSLNDSRLIVPQVESMCR